MSVQLHAQVAAHVQEVDLVHRVADAQVDSVMVKVADKATVADNAKVLAPVDLAHRVADAHREDHVLKVDPHRVLRELHHRNVKVADVVHHQR